MHNSIISNFQPGGHTKVIERVIATADDLFVAVAFFKISGFDLLRNEITAMSQRKCSVTFIVGTDFFLTDPEALAEIYELLQGNARARLYIFERSTKSTFHPKYYRATSSRGVTAILGSSNLTAGGLDHNIELSGRMETEKGSTLELELRAFEDNLLNDPRCRDADRLKIEHYRRQHAIWTTVTTKAADDASARVKKVTPSSVLDDFLASYLADQNHQNNFTERTQNYKTARRLLSRFADPAGQTQHEFSADYGRLVGERGFGRLWHSGSIHRSKKRVAQSFKKVRALVAEVEGNLHLPAPELFALVQKRLSNIPGLGPNIATEILHTYDPKRFPVLNKNPLTSLRELGLGSFPTAQSFSAKDYADFIETLQRLAKQCGFPDLGRTDHFLNFVFWKVKAERSGGTRKQGLPTAAPFETTP